MFLEKASSKFEGDRIQYSTNTSKIPVEMGILGFRLVPRFFLTLQKKFTISNLLSQFSGTFSEGYNHKIIILQNGKR